MLIADTSRLFEPGTTGWTVNDFDDPDVRNVLGDARVEIVDGVLTTMPPPGFGGIAPLHLLRRSIERQLDQLGLGGEFFTEVDVRLKSDRLALPDMIFMTPAQLNAQRAAERQKKKSAKMPYHPIYAPPLLVIESLSEGHEAHDRNTKRRWYAEFGVPFYWILSGIDRSLVCLRLEDNTYATDCESLAGEELQVEAFPGVTIRPGDLWR